MENVIKHRDIKLVTTEAKKNYLLSVSNYGTTNKFVSNRTEKNADAHE